MPTLLHLDSSPLESSISRELTREFVKTWKTAHPGWEGDLPRSGGKSAPKPVDAPWIGAAYTPRMRGRWNRRTRWLCRTS